MNSTETERQHFNSISSQRSTHGYVPDFQRLDACDFFYLSPLRRGSLARLVFYRSSQHITSTLLGRIPKGSRVLDLGCGSGWFSLELARAGFHVTAVDLSDKSIELARSTLAGADLGGAGGSVTYHACDLNTWQLDRDDYAAVCYIGILHHLAEPNLLVRRISEALPPKHLMVAQEPLPNNYGPVESAVALLVRTLLASNDSWYEALPIPTDDASFRKATEDIEDEFREWGDKKERRQSPMNNASDGAFNIRVLSQFYDLFDRQDILPLQGRIVGGLRMGDDARNLAMAEFLTRVEELLMQSGAIRPGACNVVGVSKR